MISLKRQTPSSHELCKGKKRKEGRSKGLNFRN